MTPTKSSANDPELFYWTRRSDGEFESIRETVKAGRHLEGHAALRTKDNRCITVETTILPRFDDAGKFENAISIRTDVSRAKAEGAEEGRNAIIEALPDEVYIYDAETFRLSYANENARRRMRRSLAMSRTLPARFLQRR
jgi:two-component system sensor histidine kinase VicK